MENKVTYGEIKTIRIARGLWQAETEVTKPLKLTLTMTGKSENIAKEKLKLFLAGEPYKYLDNQ